jgi:hypothetical protein
VPARSRFLSLQCCGDVEEAMLTALTAFAVCLPPHAANITPNGENLMDSKNRLTAQGIRDLNYYGPRRVPVVALSPEGPASEPAAEPTVIAAEPTAPVGVGAVAAVAD